MKLNSAIIFINRIKNKLINQLGKHPVFYQSPNKFAPKLHLEIKDNCIEVNGYQKYIIYNNKIIPDRNSYDLLKKYNLLNEILDKSLSEKTFLDLGANSGFFTFLAHQNGAKCIAIDMDEDYISILNKIFIMFINLFCQLFFYLLWQFLTCVVYAVAWERDISTLTLFRHV